MIYSATLKKPWRSPRGRLYPAGTTFKLIERNPVNFSSIYDFNAPGTGYGWVVLPDKIFRQATEEERLLKENRRKIREEHLRSYTYTLHP